jgi:hypothetical protein
MSNRLSPEEYDRRKQFVQDVSSLTNAELIEIVRILRVHKFIYSENSNGVFINLQNINEKTVDKIFNFINYIKQKKEELVKYEELIDNAKKNIGNVKKEISNNVINLKKEKYIDYNYYDNDSENDNNDENIDNDNILLISSDEDEDIENKISLKKKKIKYVGKKAKIIKSIKDNQDNKNKLKK